MNNLNNLKTGKSRHSGTWTPALLTTTPSVWLNDSSSVTDAGSGACSQWNDLSGNAYHFTQGTSANRPLIVSSGLNGRRIIRFDGSNDLLFNNSAGARGLSQNKAALCQFLVYKKTATDAGVARLATFMSNGTNGNSRFTIAASGAGGGEANKTRAVIRRLDADSAGVLTQGTSLGTAWQVVILRVEYSTGDGYLDIDGTNDQTNLALTSSGSTENTISIDSISLGGSTNTGATPTTANAADIDVAEFGIITGALTQAEVDKTFGYLHHRWGLQANLPNGHPYKIYAP